MSDGLLVPFEKPVRPSLTVTSCVLCAVSGGDRQAAAGLGAEAAGLKNRVDAAGLAGDAGAGGPGLDCPQPLRGAR